MITAIRIIIQIHSRLQPPLLAMTLLFFNHIPFSFSGEPDPLVYGGGGCSSPPSGSKFNLFANDRTNGRCAAFCGIGGGLPSPSSSTTGSRRSGELREFWTLCTLRRPGDGGVDGGFCIAGRREDGMVNMNAILRDGLVICPVN